MSTRLESSLSANLQAAAQQAGLVVLSVDTGSDFNGHPTTRFRLGVTTDASAERTLLLELSESFDFHQAGIAAGNDQPPARGRQPPP